MAKKKIDTFLPRVVEMGSIRNKNQMKKNKRLLKSIPIKIKLFPCSQISVLYPKCPNNFHLDKRMQMRACDRLGDGISGKAMGIKAVDKNLPKNKTLHPNNWMDKKPSLESSKTWLSLVHFEVFFLFFVFYYLFHQFFVLCRF